METYGSIELRDGVRLGRKTCALQSLVVPALLICLSFALLTGCARTTTSSNDGNETTQEQGSSDSAQHVAADNATSSASTTDDTSTANNEPATTPDGTSLAESMPYVGMSVQNIDDTWMGAHDSFRAKWDRDGTSAYFWSSKNGRHDAVLRVDVRDGQVTAVTKICESKAYWWDEVDGQRVEREFPNLSAAVSTSKPAATLPDPQDYDDPYDYALDAEDYFKEKGSADPEGDAIDWWDRNAG